MIYRILHKNTNEKLIYMEMLQADNARTTWYIIVTQTLFCVLKAKHKIQIIAL